MKNTKAYKGMAMEGVIASWYARNTTGRQEDTRRLAQRISALLAPGSSILEVAPGPGYLTIELARSGKFAVTGLDISRSFVGIARSKALEAGVKVDFRLGSASEMPLDAESFDFVVCQAAFKNFTRPVQAIAEMHRVLKPGGRAVIIDLRRDAPQSDIDESIAQMGQDWFNAALTRFTFRLMLLKSAYTVDQMRAFVAQTPFHSCRIESEGMGFEVWLEK